MTDCAGTRTVAEVPSTATGVCERRAPEASVTTAVTLACGADLAELRQVDREVLGGRGAVGVHERRGARVRPDRGDRARVVHLDEVVAGRM